MVPDIAHDPIAIGLFGAIGVVVIPQDLSNLIHESELRVRAEFFCICHAINAMMQYMEKSRRIFHILYINIIIDGNNSMLYT